MTTMNEKETRGSIRRTDAVDKLKAGHMYTTPRQQRRLEFGFNSTAKHGKHRRDEA